MKILYITQFYPPEPMAASVRAQEFAMRWVRKGHPVTIMTGFPNYPEGKIFPGYRNRLISQEYIDGVRIIRMFTFVHRKNILFRLVNQAVFYLATLLGGFISGKQDVLLATSPPLGVGITGYCLSRLKRIPLVFEVRDLFPESAQAMGITVNPLIILVASWIERFCYRKATRIVGNTQGICDNISDRGFNHGKVRKITNGVNIERFSPTGKPEDLLKIHNLDGKFVVLYGGLFGIAQNLFPMLEAARLLRENDRIKFLLVGDGVERDRLVRTKEEFKLDNVLFLPRQAPERMEEFINLADVGYDSRKNVGLTRGALPVKVFEYMACGKPVILSGHGEAEEMVKGSGGGIVVPPENPGELAQAITRLAEDHNLGKEMGKKGMEFVKNNFSRESLSQEYLELLKKL